MKGWYGEGHHGHGGAISNARGRGPPQVPRGAPQIGRGNIERRGSIGGTTGGYH